MYFFFWYLFQYSVYCRNYYSVSFINFKDIFRNIRTNLSNNRPWGRDLNSEPPEYIAEASGTPWQTFFFHVREISMFLKYFSSFKRTFSNLSFKPFFHFILIHFFHVWSFGYCWCCLLPATKRMMNDSVYLSTTSPYDYLIITVVVCLQCKKGISLLISQEKHLNRLPNIAVRWSTLLLPIREFQSSHLGPDTSYSDWVLSWFYSFSPGKFRDNTSNYSTVLYLSNHYSLAIL